MYLINISGKAAKHTIKETDLFKFSDEIVEVDLEERRRQALDTAEYFAKMAPGICKRGKDGKALIYGEDN
jgi:choline kinase